MSRLKVFHSRLCGQVTPILSPLSGGRSMYYSPGVIIGSLMMYITGQSHDLDCTCEICEYREVGAETKGKREEAKQKILSHAGRALVRSSRLAPPVQTEYVTGDEAAYWAQWTFDNFPHTSGPSWPEIYGKLEDSNAEFLFDTILSAVANDAVGALTLSEKQNFFRAWNQEETTSQDLLNYLAEMQMAQNES